MTLNFMLSFWMVGFHWFLSTSSTRRTWSHHRPIHRSTLPGESLASALGAGWGSLRELHTCIQGARMYTCILHVFVYTE
jgi:hypothetical protein